MVTFTTVMVTFILGSHHNTIMVTFTTVHGNFYNGGVFIKKLTTPNTCNLAFV